MEKPNIAGTMPIVMEMHPGTYYWCACGLSKSQPFCDGSHRTTPFTPVEISINEARKVAWCLCKHTNRKPFCDGSHRTI
ncbi:MAG: CDGSH iron-sulfur domain-containing protein [Chitinophagales bacterium]|nr:CDGSH iron-sulfur domain-containing protein [Chitinophagales bacterium]MDW8427379.1 CDGSH iron-sulfur domain-containing protein [Chitinophagales bacterium]